MTGDFYRKSERRPEDRAETEMRAAGTETERTDSFLYERQAENRTEGAEAEALEPDALELPRRISRTQIAPKGRQRRVTKHTYRGKVQRDLRVDNVRGILIILVVIGHFLLPLYKTRFITGLSYAIYVFHMPCFVMISGFYAKSVYKGGRFRWGKIVQFLWLYLLFKLIVNVTEGMLAGYIPLFPNLLHESGAPWYLLSLSTWYLTLPLIRRLSGGRRNLLVLVMVLLLVVFGKYAVRCGDLLAIDRTLSFAPFFYLGYFTTQEKLDSYLESRWKPRADILALICLLVVFLLTYDLLYDWHLVAYGADYHRYPPQQQPVLWEANLIWYLIAGVISLGLIGNTLNRRMLFLTDLGQRTLQVYILHRPIRDLMQYFGLYELVSPHSKIQVLLLCGFGALLAVLLGNDVLTRLFGRLRTAPDALLRKLGAL